MTICKLCAKTLHPSERYAEMFLVLYDKSPDNIVSKHESIPLCEYCHNDILLKAGYVT